MDVKKIPSIPPGGGWKVHDRGNAPARGAGWTFGHSIVDDYTCFAYPEPLSDEKGTPSPSSPPAPSTAAAKRASPT